MNPKHLPEELAWTGEHASEIAIAAIADAQRGVVPDGVYAHLETCRECNEAVAQAALLSVQAGHALQAMPETALASSPMRSPLPWRALLAAAAVGLVGAIRALLEAPSSVSSAEVSILHSAPLFAKAFTHLLHSEGAPLWLTLSSAALLVVLGFAVTRALPAPLSRRVES
jgi:hypothetical protein